MDILQNTTTCQWVGNYLFFYVIAALIICYLLLRQKIVSIREEEEPTPKDVVNYFLIGGAVASGITLAMGIIGIMGNNPETRNVLSLGDVGFAIVAMVLITALVSFLAPLLLIVVTFLLKAAYVTVVYLVTTLIVKPLQAWGDFLTRKTTNSKES